MIPDESVSSRIACPEELLLPVVTMWAHLIDVFSGHLELSLDCATQRFDCCY
jgi:hypothetical protein